MTDRPACLPSREVLTGYLVALIPPSITTLDEQLDLLEEEFVRVAELAVADQESTRRAASLDELVYGNPRAMHELVELRVALDKAKEPTR